jgi:hypothetical protein
MIINACLIVNTDKNNANHYTVSPFFPILFSFRNITNFNLIKMSLHGFRAFENREARRIFEPKSKELHSLYSLQNIRVIK